MRLLLSRLRLLQMRRRRLRRRRLRLRSLRRQVLHGAEARVVLLRAVAALPHQQLERAVPVWGPYV